MKKRLLSLLLVLVMVLGMLPVAAFADELPFSVTADGETAELSYVGEFADRQYGYSKIPVYLAQVSEAALISVPYESGYRTFGSNYFSEADLVDMTKETLAPYFTTPANYGLTTENSVAYVELRDSNFNSVYGVLIELLPGESTDPGETSEKLTGITGVASSTNEEEGAVVGNAFDGDYGTYWATAAGGSLEDSYLIADLGGTYTINKVEYTKRYDSGALYNCTGNLLNYVIEVSTDGETWTQAAEGATSDGTTVIEFTPVQAAYVRLTSTSSYHWDSAQVNSVMCAAELAVYQAKAEQTEPEAAVTVTYTDGTALEVTSLGNQSYSDGYAYDPSMVTVPFFTVKVNEGSDFVIDGSAVGTVNAFHVSSGASLYGTHPYTMTAATLEAYFLMSAEAFNERFTFEHGLNTENKVAFIEARNSGDRVYCLLVELIPGGDDSGSGDSGTETGPVSVTANDTAVEVAYQGAFADKQWWGSSQIPVYYAQVSEDATVSVTYGEDYLALGSDYFSSLDPSALTGVTKTNLEAYFTTASDYGLDTANSVAYIEFASNDGYYTSVFGLLIELIPVSEPEPEPEPVAAPVSVTANDAAVEVTSQGNFADKQYWGSTYIPVYYAQVPENAAISVSYSEDYLALGSDYFSSLEQSALTGMTSTDLEAYFTTASDYGLDTANSVAYIEFASNDGYYTSLFGLLIELVPGSGEPDPEPVAAPVSVTADDEAVEVTNQGMFGNKMYYGSSQIPVYYAKVSETAILNITYGEEYSALDNIYLFSIDPSELMGITGADLKDWFTNASDYGLDTANSVAYIEFANGFDPAFGLLVELEPAAETPCEHQWQEATCVAPKTCLICGATEGEALGHDWKGTSCQRCDATRENPFTDVPEGSYYINPVLWAVEQGITNGITDTLFDPNGVCNRGQVVTFLWRAMGSPEPTSTESPFVDVTNEKAFYYKAVLWAYENGITAGIDATHFGPTVACNRAQVVTFLWRTMGEPEPTTTESSFSDVTNPNASYYKAVLWAVEEGITNGMGDGTFGTKTTCNRAQVVTFLYRTLAK